MMINSFRKSSTDVLVLVVEMSGAEHYLMKQRYPLKKSMHEAIDKELGL